jgi:uncharacterized membrane protein
VFEEKKIFIPKFALIIIAIFTILFILLIKEQNTLLNLYNDFRISQNTIVILGGMAVLFFILWSYCILSVLKNSFKKDSDKIAWMIALIIIPITAIFYLDIKDLQIQK